MLGAQVRQTSILISIFSKLLKGTVSPDFRVHQIIPQGVRHSLKFSQKKECLCLHMDSRRKSSSPRVVQNPIISPSGQVSPQTQLPVTWPGHVAYGEFYNLIIFLLSIPVRRSMKLFKNILLLTLKFMFLFFCYTNGNREKVHITTSNFNDVCQVF